MRRELRMRYVERVYRRYREASKESKGRILDELCRVCGYTRKYAIWKLAQLPCRERVKPKVPRRRARKYGPEVGVILEAVWEVANYPWSVRLKEILRLWLPWMKSRYRLTGEVERRLLSISPSTIDRHLQLKRRKLKRRLYGRTKPGTLLRHQIPVRTEHWDVERPGFVEADLVSHCGGCGSGEFIHSLNLTDIHSAWVETRAVMGKSEAAIVEAIEEMAQALPFKILGLDSDNGSEFINHHLVRYCKAHGIQFTRSRPYKKDDNAHIEQKNWTHVRKFMGWDRYDSTEALKAMNNLYSNELSLFMNLFQPSVKLKKTIRRGSSRKHIYDKPQTPLDRLLASRYLTKAKATHLKALREQLDPFGLAEEVNKKLERTWNLTHYHFNPAKETQNKPNTQHRKLSSMEKETLAAISQALGMNAYVKDPKTGKLILISHG